MFSLLSIMNHWELLGNLLRLIPRSCHFLLYLKSIADFLILKTFNKKCILLFNIFIDQMLILISVMNPWEQHLGNLWQLIPRSCHFLPNVNRASNCKNLKLQITNWDPWNWKFSAWIHLKILLIKSGSKRQVDT